MSSVPYLKLLTISEIAPEENQTELVVHPKSTESRVQKFTDCKLCEIIVSARYLGIMKDEAVESMEELSKRRNAGSKFDFEQEIQKLKDSLPKFNLNLSEVFKKWNLKL